MIEEFQNWLISTKATSSKPPLLVILGPTGSGKTALSLALAHALNGEIISTDSRQIYKEIDIGSDKIPLEKREGIPHYMIDIAAPDEIYTMGDFKRDAEIRIKEIISRGKIPMLVGGTGLYIRAIVQDYDLPPVLPNLELRESFKTKLKDELYAMLLDSDPETATKIHKNNIPYVTRALEIIASQGQKTDTRATESPYNTFMLGISWPRETLYERIDQRVENQFANGLIEESKKLLQKYDINLPSMSSLGLKEFTDYFANKITLDDVKKAIKQGTRQYAKRQVMWFKKEPNVNWIEGIALEETTRAILAACQSLENAGK